MASYPVLDWAWDGAYRRANIGRGCMGWASNPVNISWFNVKRLLTLQNYPCGCKKFLVVLPKHQFYTCF
jgi:hypothetical protein